MGSAKYEFITENEGYGASVRWALASLSLSMLMSSLDTSIANVGLPTLAQVFNASMQEVQWVVLAYLLVITTLIVSAGCLGDIIGRRHLLLAGISLFTVTSFLCGAAHTLWLLIAARAVQGLGAAIMMALTVALVGEIVPRSKTGSAMGLLGTMSAIGTALGPSLGGFLIAGPGWRSIFFVNVPLGMLNFFLARRYLPAHEQRGKADRNSFDNLGTLLLGLTLMAYALAVTVGDGHFDRFNVVLLLIAVFGGSLFVFAESKVTSPLIRLKEFRNVIFSTSLMMNLLVATVMMTTLVVGPFYLSRGLGLKVAFVGIVMSVGPVISALSGIPAGRIVDLLGAKAVVMIGLIAMTLGLFALSILPGMFGVAGYIAAVAVLTPVYQLFQAANNTTVMMDVQTDRRGVISGMLSLSRNLGLMTGASVMGVVFALASGAAHITTARPEEVASGMRLTFIIAGIMMVLALFIAVVRRTSVPVN